MNATIWVTLACALPAFAGIAWQIRHDLKKDRADREDAARALAVRLAVIEERQREERDRDDDA